MFIVDCQPVQRVASGHSPLECDDLLDVYERMTSNIHALFKAGWKPPRPWEDPVSWFPRENNIVADYLVNYTMDVQESWSQTIDWPFGQKSMGDCSYIVHSDGGTRGGRCSGCAFIIEAGILENASWIFKPIVLSGTYLRTPVSSFTVESLALEEATLCLKRLLLQCVPG